MIHFGEWLPDIAAYGNQGSTEAKNVVPTIDGFKEMKGLNAYTTALNLFCRGAFAAQAADKTSYNYAGSGSKLYQLSDNTWTDQSKASGTYAVSAAENWEFIKWGEKIIAVGGINAGTPVPPQIITLGAVGSTEFADLGGSPPQARHIAVVRDFVVLGNLYESATDYPGRIRWSGVNDETEWTTSPAAQSDFQDLQGNGGWVQAIRGGQFGLIWQERAIVRQDYIGPPLVFSFNTILPGIGTQAPNSVIQYGGINFFLSQSGFKAIKGGEQILDIGENKLDRWFLSRFDEANKHRMVGAIDRRNRRLMWIFTGTGNTSGLPNEGVMFDLASGKWSRFEAEIEWVYNSFGVDTTLDGLDSVSTSIDALPVSLDSPEWVGGAINISGFDSTHKSGLFEGAALEATMDTKEERLSEQNRTMITRVRPEVENVGTTTTVAAGTRDNLNDSVTYGSAASEERDGNHAMRVGNRFIRFRVNVTGGFDKALGVTVVEGSRSSVY